MQFHKNWLHKVYVFIPRLPGRGKGDIGPS